MKIAHVIESRGPGGAETIMFELVNRSRDADTQALAVLPSEESWLGRTLSSEVQRIVEPRPRGLTGPLDVEYLRELRRLFISERPHVVHAHSFDSALYSALALLGVPGQLIVTFHGASDVKRFGIKNRLKWLALRRAHALVCVSDSLSVLAHGTPGLPQQRIRTILNGVDLKRTSQPRSVALRAQLGLSPGTTLIGALGNIRAPKGYQFLLPAIADLRASGEDVHLVIAGDDKGARADALRAQRVALGLEEHITLLGFTDDPGAFLANVDLFVLSSTSEGFSLSTVQAMAAGLPVLATRSGGPEELISHDVHGLLVDVGSSDSIAQGLRLLLGDAARRNRLSSAARIRARDRFSIEAMVARYRELYYEAASR